MQSTCHLIHYGSHPRLPLEICEEIIDWVAVSRTPGRCNLRVQRTLLACALVCRAWKWRAKMHLYTRGDVTLKHVRTFGNALKNNTLLSMFIVELNLVYAPPFLVSALLASHKLPQLRALMLGYLDLIGEHSLLHRAISFHSVRDLRLAQLRPCKASQLIRFINYFHCLSSLELQQFTFESLGYQGQSLPKAFNASTRSLTALSLELIPGMFRVIRWFLKAGIFLKNVKQLTLTCENRHDKAQLRSAFQGVDLLLDCCSPTVEELDLRFLKIPMIEEISDLFRLDRFKKLRRLTYDGEMYRNASVFLYAARQLSTLPASINVAQICIRVNEPDANLCKGIDEALVGGTFPSLRKVEVCGEVHFPLLRQSGILVSTLKDAQ